MDTSIRADVKAAYWKVIIALDSWTFSEMTRDLNYDHLLNARDSLQCILDTTKEET